MGEPARIPSHRATTSSRTPGRVNRGTVWHAAIGLRKCEDCQSWTSANIPPGHHAPHVRVIDGEHRLVNCAGRVLR